MQYIPYAISAPQLRRSGGEPILEAHIRERRWRTVDDGDEVQVSSIMLRRFSGKGVINGEPASTKVSVESGLEELLQLALSGPFPDQ